VDAPARDESDRTAPHEVQTADEADGNRGGEASVYRILAFVAMKMEMSWKNAPFRNSGFRKLKPSVGYFAYES
jgi:hypothetical protein